MGGAKFLQFGEVAITKSRHSMLFVPLNGESLCETVGTVAPVRHHNYVHYKEYQRTASKIVDGKIEALEGSVAGKEKNLEEVTITTYINYGWRL